jgi:hypothetical protein
MTPRISVQITEDGYELVASSYSVNEPAGPRLFRAPPWPEVRFSHDTRAEAERDRDMLQRYLDNPGRSRTRKGDEEARPAETIDLSEAVWNV